MLEIKNISFNYLKGMPILKDISLNIKAGEIVGILVLQVVEKVH